jgi:3-dehydroquinate synthase
MKSIVTQHYAIHFNSACYTELNAFLNNSNFSKIFVLVDTNTHNHCLPIFLSHLVVQQEIEIIEIEAGEINKTIDTCVGVWNTLSDLNADRKSLMINLGGGVVTDLGGFIASTFKRGIAYINIPTSLLAMVDASIGGKTGVDLGTLKNQIGIINFSEMVLIDTAFLDTLPTNEMRSGLAEMLKHGLIHDQAYWDKMSNLTQYTLTDLDLLIYESVQIKKEIVTKDPTEKGLRKTLNFGHTLGHAIESYFLSESKKTHLLHGEAIAIGMILACYISYKQEGFPKEKLEFIKTKILNTYGKIAILESDYPPIIELLIYDKKNTHGNINFVLLKDIGKTKIDCTVDNATIREAFSYYMV